MGPDLVPREVADVGRLHSVQADVLAFHDALDLTIGDLAAPEIKDAELRADLILEEAAETAEAITGRRVLASYAVAEPAARPQGLVQAIDGLCDLLAVIYGAAVTFGIDLRPFWDEVHRTNMAKAGGPKREDGKQLKPDGWQPPDIAGVLEDLYGYREEEK
jgi:predicted HAD superfamily Cof-like phosphohydrolase